MACLPGASPDGARTEPCCVRDTEGWVTCSTLPPQGPCRRRAPMHLASNYTPRCGTRSHTHTPEASPTQSPLQHTQHGGSSPLRVHTDTRSPTTTRRQGTGPPSTGIWLVSRLILHACTPHGSQHPPRSGCHTRSSPHPPPGHLQAAPPPPSQAAQAPTHRPGPPCNDLGGKENESTPFPRRARRPHS